MTRARQLFLVSLLLLPALVPLGVALDQARSLNEAQRCLLKITGYDPRHLLYGRYLRFRFEPKQDTPEAQACLAALPEPEKARPYYTDENEAPRLEKQLREAGTQAWIEVFVRKNKPPLFGALQINSKDGERPNPSKTE